VQRKSKRQVHSQFHNMILRYDDAFWATGTLPTAGAASAIAIS